MSPSPRGREPAEVRAEGVVRELFGASLNACVDPGDVAEVAVRALGGGWVVVNPERVEHPETPVVAEYEPSVEERRNG